MAHRISIQNGKAEFAYVGEQPWHGLGELVPNHMSPVEAVAKVIPWTVSTRPVAYPTFEGGAFVRSGGDLRVIARDDNHQLLGWATKSYQPIQNAQAADVAEALIAEGAKSVETIGALDDGARCFMLLALDKSGFEVKAGDVVLPYFLLRWGHDGRTTLAGKLTNVRVVCHNTLTAAGRAFAFDVKHTANSSLRIDDAREALGVVRKAYVETRIAYRELAQARIAPQAAVDYFGGVFQAPVNGAGLQFNGSRIVLVKPQGVNDEQVVKIEKWEAIQRRLLALYQGEGKGSLQAGPTAWGAYNAVTEYLDHVYPVCANGKVSQQRQQSVLFGAYSDVRDAAYQSALQLVG